MHYATTDPQRLTPPAFFGFFTNFQISIQWISKEEIYQAKEYWFYFQIQLTFSA
jgi:hypothetical protein